MGYSGSGQTARFLCCLLVLVLLMPACVPSKTVLPPESRQEPGSVSPAARPLLANALVALDRRDLTGAEAYLERAIRIEPGNPFLWHILAQTKYQQGDYAQTVQLCLRSNALLPRAAALRRDNLQLQALAYHQLGEEDKAKQAISQAGEL